MAIDLDKARAARREAEQRGPVVILDGVEYELAVEMPLGVLEAFRGMTNEETAPAAMADLAQALLGEHYETIRGQLTIADLNELVQGAMQEYGVEHPLPSSAS